MRLCRFQTVRELNMTLSGPPDPEWVKKQEKLVQERIALETGGIRDVTDDYWDEMKANLEHEPDDEIVAGLLSYRQDLADGRLTGHAYGFRLIETEIYEQELFRRDLKDKFVAALKEKDVASLQQNIAELEVEVANEDQMPHVRKLRRRLLEIYEKEMAFRHGDDWS
jgi:hypothetical protein